MMHAHDNQMRVYLQRESTHTQTLNKNQGQSLRELAAHDKKKKMQHRTSTMIGGSTTHTNRTVLHTPNEHRGIH